MLYSLKVVDSEGSTVARVPAIRSSFGDVMETVVRCLTAERTLAFDAEGQSWFVIQAEDAYLVGDGSFHSTMAVLPFMEQSLDGVKESVSEFLKHHPEQTFPYEAFIRSGFMHGSPHWTDCSLRWLSELDGLDVDFTEDLVRVVQSTKRYSQKSRHLARKLLKRKGVSRSK